LLERPRPLAVSKLLEADRMRADALLDQIKS
jgi:hypothetical protein